MNDQHGGSCLCGHVKFRVSGPSSNVGSCHCRMCQKAIGAACLTAAEFSKDQVEWLNEPPLWRTSSDKAERGFCPKCGAAVSFRFIGSDSVDLAVALFDDPKAFPPTYDIYTESAQPWTKLDPAIPQFKRGREEG